ncbi:GGDEF domain-containing protein [Sphingomonas sp. Leaf17]|uniref:GGDEF domain-containing protein n=1 Tax=Sphingomonas sp. Leaf17 TaxID=1735683 RepID=UPI0006F4B05D|nr:GGDEF domain-containing protein [Sphingomonas sp. Leaf17]
MYALIVNASVALLFAVAFAVIRLSYPGQRQVIWYGTAYLIGMLTPLSELGVRFTAWDSSFVASSYGTFLVSGLAMSIGLAATAGRPAPWRLVGAILAGGILARIVIWGGPRNDLGYELAYQAPFMATAALSMSIAIGAARRTGQRLWLAVAITFGFMLAHFVTKPFFAHAFGSGTTAMAYSTSAYALFSQATGGVLIVMAGLFVLLVVVQAAMGQTISESETDPLTVVANRRGLARQAARMIAEMRRTDMPLALIFFDLDHFKRINDTFGHAVGDAVLRAFADTLRRTVSPSAVIARIGGEEFVVMLDRTTLRGAWQVAQAIRRTLPDLGGALPAVTVSGGIADLQPGDTVETLLDRADRWAYVAKADGRNRIAPVADAGIGGLRTVARA